MAAIKFLNLALAFILELCALAALGYWGFHTGSSLIMKLLLGLGAPLLAAVFWGVFVAPKAVVRVSEPIRLLLAAFVFALASVGLALAGQLVLAWALALVFLANRALLFFWDKKASE